MVEGTEGAVAASTSDTFPQRKGRRTRWGQSASEAAIEAEKQEPEPQTTVPSIETVSEDVPFDIKDDETTEEQQQNTEKTDEGATEKSGASEINAEAKPAIIAAMTAVAAAGAVAVNTTAHFLPPGVRLLAKQNRTTSAGSSAASQILSDVASRAAAARAALEKAKKALALQRQINEQVTAMRVGKAPNLLMTRDANAIVTAGVTAVLRALPQTKPLRFDRLGRQVDAEGKVIEIKPVAHSTLKVNINKEREAKLKQVAFRARVDRNLTNPSSNPWFDSSLSLAGPKIRSKALCFVEKGFYAKREKQMRVREQAQSLGYTFASETANNEKRTDRLGESMTRSRRDNGADAVHPHADEEPDDGISAVSKRAHRQAFLKTISENNGVDTDDYQDSMESGLTRRQEALHVLQRRQLGIIPDIEWWDQPLLRRLPDIDCLDDEDPDFPYVIAEAAITDLVEHPVPIPPVMDASSNTTAIMHLTPKERRKLRQRKRQEAERDKQDKIRMGLMAPPPPKVKLANLMRVLGQSAAAHPSAVEGQVKDQMAARLRAHQERNEGRRLDAESRRKKTISKWTQSSNDVLSLSGGADVCLFAVKDLSDKKYLYKVDKNAQQYHVTGGAILCPPLGNLIVAEGTKKALRGYKKLLLRRVKWPKDNTSQDPMDTKLQPNTFTGCENQATTEQEQELNDVLKGRGASFCKVLWEGVVKERAFKQWRIYDCKTEAEVRRILADRHSEHYWDILRKYRDPCKELL